MSAPEQAERVESIPRVLWERIRAEPDRAPEHIALAAADRFAPVAERWAAARLPYEDPAAVAKTAHRKHIRLSRLEGAALGLGGAVTAAADLVALGWIQCRMVFFIAAAYGYDPHHPMRPAELLAIQQIYPTAEEARAGLDGVGKHMAIQFIESRRGNDDELVKRLVMYAGKRVVKRGVLRVVPVIASPIAAVQNAKATTEVGKRALRFYGG